MTKFMTFGRNAGIAFAVLMFIALPFASVQAADLGGYSYDYFVPDTSYSYDYYVPDYSYSYDYYVPDYSYSYDYYVPDYSYSYDYYVPEYDYSYDYYVPEYDYSSSYASADASAYAYASSYSYGNSYSYNYDYDNDHGCKKNCNPPKPKPKPVCALSISPSQVDYGGDATIHWTSENATSATLSGFGSVSTGGNRDIEDIKSDKTYTLTVTGPGGTATCSDSIEVEEEEDLECELEVSDSRVERGDYVRVSWESEGSTSGRISPDIGRVDSEEGSERVRVYEDTTFKGTFSNDDDEVTCRVSVDVDHAYIPPQTPYVTLSAVPYTGFELGPVGTAIYWSLLVLWCLIAAYLIAVKKAHVGLANSMKKFFFGADEVVVTTRTTATPVHAVHSAPAHLDATDEFVLSQISRR